MSSAPAPSEMDRDDLEAEVRANRERIDELEATVERLGATVSKFLNVVNGTEYEDNPEASVDINDPLLVKAGADAGATVAGAVDRVDDVEEFVETYGDQKARDPDEAWVQIVQAAKNLADNPANTVEGTAEVCLYVENLEQATGYSDRHCSNLIEEYGEEKAGARWVPYKPASASSNGSAQRKHLVVDLDVWGDRL